MIFAERLVVLGTVRPFFGPKWESPPREIGYFNWQFVY